MIPSNPLDQNSAYVDFSQFGKLRADAKANKEAALEETAKQLEGVFLNMMLKSMRDANSTFSEGNYLSDKDTEFYQNLYDHQLSLNLAQNHGIGLAAMIVRQMQALENKNQPQPDNSKGYDVSGPTGRLGPTISGPLKLQEYDGNSMPLRHNGAPVNQGPLPVSNHPASYPVQIPVGTGENAAPVAPTSSSKAADSTSANADSEASPAVSWNSPQQFVETIWPYAQKAAKQLNADPLAIVAQAVLETGWGRHSMTKGDGNQSFNLFGIKADASWKGEVVRKKTLEYRNGIAASESAAFRSYSSLQDAFNDYVKFLKENSNYQGVFMPGQAASNWGFALQDAGYATDPNYGNKIANILESDILQSKVAGATTTL